MRMYVYVHLYAWVHTCNIYMEIMCIIIHVHLDKYSIFLSTVKINEPQKKSDNKITHWNLFSLAEILINTCQFNSSSTEQTRCSFFIILGQRPIDTQRCTAKYTIHIDNSEMASLDNDIVK